MDNLSPEQIEANMGGLPQWSLNGDSLQRTFRFADFVGSMAFVQHVADLAEEMRHHPDIMIRYDKVTLTLTTQDAGGLTEQDFTFAKATDDCVPATKEA